MKNIILLRDKDSKHENIDLIILTDETRETIESEIERIKEKWYSEDCPPCLLDEIIDTLTDKYDIEYMQTVSEIYY
jgi:DNA transposition AAA+ family ATPase